MAVTVSIRCRAVVGKRGHFRANSRVHIHLATYLSGAGTDEGIRRDRIEHEDGFDRAELIQQPAGVVDTPVCNERVDHTLVLGRALEASGEPAVAAGARTLGPKRV